MSWFYELAWLWKGLGISLLAAAGFAAAVVVILLLAQTPTPI